MTKTILLNRRSLLAKLFVLVMLLVGGGSFLNLSAQKELPYEYGFENNNLAGEGWTTNNLQSGSYNSALYSSSYASHTGDYSFRFYSNENPPQYLISPLLAESENAVVVSLYYKNALSSNTESFCVGYATVSSTPSTSDFTWDTQVDCKSSSYALYEHTFPASARYIAIKSTTATASDKIGSNYYLMIDDITIAEDDPYKTPTDFALSSFTSTSATFSWTAGNGESSWKFAYSTDPDFTPSIATATSITANPYTLSGLTEGTTYYACICADYGDSNYSEWTNKVTFTPNDEMEILKYDGSTASYNIPISSSNVNNSTALTQTQFIIPSGDLTSIQNRQITKLTFYASRNSVTWGAATFEVYLKETNNTSYSTSDKKFESWGTCVYNNQGLSTNSTNGQMEIILNTPFNYTTGNLMIGLKQLTKGTAPSTTYWYSTQPYANNAIYSYGTYVGVLSYSPKITILTVASSTAPVKIGSTGYTTFASQYPLDFSSPIDGLTAYYVASGDVDAEKAKLTEVTTEVSAGTGLVLKGTPGTTYFIPVAASGSDISGNLMVGCTSETVLTTSASKYVLVNNAGTPEFQDLSENGATIPAGKAYLNASGAGSRLSIVFDDPVVTGIAVSKVAERSSNGIVYNLMGQKVVKPSNGLYVINGKKVIKK